MVAFFFVNFGLAAANVYVPYVNLPWGMSGSGQAPRNIFMFTPADLVGKAPPAGAKTIPLEQLQDLEGDFWNGALNTQYSDPEDKQSSSQFWKDYFDNPSNYGTPKGVATDLWATKQAEVKALGIGSKEDLLKIFQTDPKHSQEICLNLKAGYCITSSAGSGPSAFVITVGFKPFSDLWDLRVTSAGVVSHLMDGVTPETIMKSLVEGQGFTEKYAKQVFQAALATHGTSFKPDVTWGSGNLQELWATDSRGSPTTAPAVHSVTEPTWMMVTQAMLDQAGGKIVLPGGQVMVKPGIASFNGIPGSTWFETYKIPIGEMMGGRELTLYVDGKYLEYVTQNSGVTSAKSSSKKEIWDMIQSSNLGAADPRVLADYAQWCISRKEEWKLTGYSPLPPGKVYAEYGINPSSYAPSPATAELDLFMVSFIPKGQEGALSETDASIVQRYAMKCLIVTDDTYAKMKNEGLKITVDGKVFDVSQVISASELARYEDLKQTKFIERLKDFAIESGAIASMTRQETQKYVDLLSQLDPAKNPDAGKTAKELADAWNQNQKDTWSGFADRNKNTNPNDLSVVDKYTLESSGYEWNGKEWEFEGIDKEHDGSPPPPAPDDYSHYGSRSWLPNEQFYSWLKFDLRKLSPRITSSPSSVQVFNWLSGAGFKVGQNWAVYLPSMGTELKQSFTSVKLRNPGFTFALFSPDYSNVRSMSYSWFGSTQVPLVGVSMDRAWWIELTIGCALIIMPLLDTKKLARKMR